MTDGPAASWNGSFTLLLTEDEDAVRAPLVRFLRRRGFSVLEARSGREALEVSQQHEGKIDLLVTDLIMPGMNGRELAERVAVGRPEIQIVYISGYNDDEIARRGLVDVRTVFLQKPFAPSQLVEVVEELLRSG
ncbi:MAG TPA: response regulator [Longimicrobiaceae bacterium]|nr:response regulator [Longimicrobiaceae bacterium]